jgi:methionyl-tRNA formyltransferase
MEKIKPRLILFGGNRKNEDGPLLKLILQMKNKFEIIVFTDQFRINLPTKNGEILKKRLNENKIKWILLNKLDHEIIKKYINNSTMGISIGALWFFKQNIIDQFKGNLFNYHNTKLPIERGASAYTWKILSQNREGGITIHKIEEKLDVGDIVAQKSFKFPKRCKIQAEYYEFLSQIETKFIMDFLNLKVKNRIKQNEIESTYWPKLDTNLHGYINWDWSAKDIEIFINAFDKPHPGAITFYDEKKIKIKNCNFKKEKLKFHPFQNGLVFRIIKNEIHVAVNGGAIIIKKILDQKNKNILSEIKLGHRFFTPLSYLEKAKTSRSSYKDEVEKYSKK